jgi:hypothetical protein
MRTTRYFCDICGGEVESPAELRLRPLLILMKYGKVLPIRNQMGNEVCPECIASATQELRGLLTAAQIRSWRQGGGIIPRGQP